MIRKRNIKFLLIRLAAFFGFINFNIYLAAQAPLDREYKAVAENRANKIVVRLGITDSSAFYKVRDIIAEQYIDLKNIHENRDAQIKAIKETNGISNQSNPESKIQLVQQNADNQLEKLHKAYMSKLSQHLSAAQVEKVKDGMTYGVLPITYKGYLEMIPRLSKEEKNSFMMPW
ncbi:MAG: DUF3826 domain-containing protein [Sphingobacteriales bacterium]|nr:DUF3826 domain-containing protein [Sphingobacteriales bacterium]